MSAMKHISLVAFLGNYGSQYAKNRHNVAWQFASSLSCASSLSWQQKFKGQVASYQITDTAEPYQVYFLKPETYMNLSGESILACAQFYKIKPEEILVVHDELELPLGTVSLKWSGGLGGHNGLRSTKECLGTADYWRLRFGIGRPNHPNVADYVLSNFSSDEAITLSQVFPQTEPLLLDVLKKDPEKLLSTWKKVKFD